MDDVTQVCVTLCWLSLFVFFHCEIFVKLSQTKNYIVVYLVWNNPSVSYSKNHLYYDNNN